MGALRVLRRCLGIAAAALAVAASASAATATADVAGIRAAPTRQTFLQFNMCGNACNHGDVAVVHNLERTIAEGRPVAVTLNEVCENQFERLRRDLPGYGGRFDPTGPRCGNGTRYGNAVLVHGPDPDPVGSWQLPNPAGDETRRVMCVRGLPPDGASLVVCVTHISFAASNIGTQIDTVATILSGLSGDEPVLLGGDFNTDPADDRLDPLYGNAGRGRFTEADEADDLNDSTFAKHKLDYIFLADGHWSAVRAMAVDAGRGLSDHSALLATATVNT
jgi:endonuclease/exonuclease/phosphatase family metal-dependent hydrolase